MDVGQLNPVSYNQLDQYNSGVLRNGRPLNDLIDGSVDYNLLSRNEVAEIELGNGFANNVYGFQNTVNIIQRQIFQNRPYTEISFIQDRYENLYFDGNFHQNLLKNLNFNFGITKHSYDGKYTNSDFDKWLGRFNLNLAASNRLNFFAYVNYAAIQKGINEGINPDTVDISNKEVIFDPDLAIVRNSDSYEKKERFDIDAGAVLLAGKNSFTRLQLYVSNSFRQYRDEENRPNPNGIFLQDNYHWINYGAKLQEILNFKFAKSINVISNSEVEYNYRIINRNSSIGWATLQQLAKSDVLFLYEGLTVTDNNFYISAYINLGSSDIGHSATVISGARAGYNISIDTLRKVNFELYVNSNDGLMGASGKFTSKDINLGLGYYMMKTNTVTRELILKGLNAFLYARLWKFDLEGLYTHNMTTTPLYNQYPKHSGNLSFSFHDAGFKNKLEYKVGLTSRFWSEYNAGRFNGRNNSLSYVYFDPNIGIYYPYDLKIPQNATLDFYIMGKIGRATFGITLENILDRVVYNTGVYPFMDRGGTANVISRFNITWNFFD